MKKNSYWTRFKAALRHRRWQLLGKKQVAEEPSLDDEAKAEFLRRLDRSKSYLEFGSGGSTIQAARRGVKTVTVENDRYFASVVQKAIGDPSSVRWRIVSIGLIEKWGRPVFHRATNRRLLRWGRYCTMAFDRIDPGAFPDLILVDGRFRVACVLESARRAYEHQVRLTVMLDDYFPKRVERYGAIRTFLGEPTIVGRAALWTLLPSEYRQTPTAADIITAIRDPE